MTSQVPTPQQHLDPDTLYVIVEGSRSRVAPGHMIEPEDTIDAAVRVADRDEAFGWTGGDDEDFDPDLKVAEGRLGTRCEVYGHDDAWCQCSRGEARKV